VVAGAASGTTVTITDRRRPVAQLTPLPTSRFAGLLATVRPARRVARQAISRRPRLFQPVL
jgi:antitoxin (DNA-binding transcriptional repressor) of toxin-antitoxin stability system